MKNFCTYPDFLVQNVSHCRSDIKYRLNVFFQCLVRFRYEMFVQLLIFIDIRMSPMSLKQQI